MGIFGRIRQRLSAVKEVLGPAAYRIVRLWEVGRPVAPTLSREKIADEGYRRGSLIQACIEERSTSVSQARLALDLDGEEAPPDDIFRHVIEHPNDELTPQGLTSRIETDLCIYGEAAILKRRSTKGVVRELHPLRIDRLEVIPAIDGSVAYYAHGPYASTRYGDAKFNPSPSEFASGVPQKFAPDDVIFMKNYNPLDDYRGLSPILALVVEGQLDLDAIAYLGAFFRNGGIPSVVITAAGELLEGQRSLIQQEYKRQFGSGTGPTGGSNFNDAMVFSHGAKIEPLGVDPSKLDIGPIFDVSESRVCALLSVPAILVGVRIGLLQAQAYGTAREARKYWVASTLVPRWDMLGQALTLGLSKDFGPRYTLRYDASDVLALQEARTSITNASVSAFYAYALSRDEVRSTFGLPPVDGTARVFRWELLAAQAVASAGAGAGEVDTGAALSAVQATRPRRMLDVASRDGAA